MRAIQTLSAVVICGLAGSLAHASVLAQEAAQWRIVLPADATAAERYAAVELQDLFERATGHAPASAEHARGRSRVIYIGAGRALQRRYRDWTPDSHGEEGFRVVIARDHIAIAGGRPRGTLYGVYEFAERYLGGRFLTADHTHVPLEPGRPLPHADFTHEPPFDFRWAYWHEVNEYPDFAARLRNNVITHDARLGGATDQVLISHSIQDQVQAGLWAQTHPEYFALVDGVRALQARHAPQVDPLHPAVQDLVTRAVREELRHHPWRRVVSVSPTDNGEYDEGWRSLRLIEREGTPMAPHLALVNEVARRIAPDHPGVMVGTLAYWATRKPPRKLRPRPNVQIQLAGFECSLVHALDDAASPANAAFMKDLDGWLGLTGQLYLWHYAANLGQVDVPIANLDTFAPSFRMLRDRGVRGVFSQGNGRCPAGEFADLKAYAVSRLLWNPDLDGEALVAEFLDLHYGPAAPHVAAAIEAMAAAHRAQGGEPASYPMLAQLGLTAPVARAFAGHLDAARRAAAAEPYAGRVDKLRITGLKAKIAASGRWELDGDRVVLAFPGEIDDWLGEYQALATRFGMDRNMEFEPLSNWLETLARNREGVPIERIENATWRLTLVPSVGGRVIEWWHKPSGSDFLAALGSPTLNLTQGTARLTGITELHGLRGPFEVVARAPGMITLSREVEGHFRVLWTLRLVRQVVHGEVTLINTGSETRRMRLALDVDFARSLPSITHDPGQFDTITAARAPALDEVALRLPSARFPLGPGGRTVMHFQVEK